MNRRLHTALLLGLVTSGAFAQSITEQEALSRALMYLDSNTSGMKVPVRGDGPKYESAHVDAEKIYVFNREGGGFIVASADCRTLPVLGYSTTGSLDWENMPDNMRAWLKGYGAAVATLGDCGDFKDGVMTGAPDAGRLGARPDKAPVEPFIKTRWGQLDIYNSQMPSYNGIIRKYRDAVIPVGCGPLAVAQVLNYYKWPVTVPDGVPDYDIVYKDGGVEDVWHINALPPVSFDWDNMLDEYERVNPETGLREKVGNKKQKKAVATLLRYCSQAARTYLDPDGSLSSIDDNYLAFLNIFGFSASIVISNNGSFSIDEWEDIIYGEVAAGRPVLYSGEADTWGHFFLCDGYDSNGLFHINWGWSGMGDGYYSLSVLKPYEHEGIEIGTGFSAYQKAIIYLDPFMDKQSAPFSDLIDLHQYNSIMVSDRSKVQVYFNYSGSDPSSVAVDYALGTNDEGYIKPCFFSDLGDSLLHYNKIVQIDVDSLSFQPGELQVLFPVWRIRKPGAEWQFILPKSPIVAGRDSLGLFHIDVYAKLNHLKCLGGAITEGQGRLGERNDLTVLVRNDSDEDYTGVLYLLPAYYGHLDSISDADEPFCVGDYMRCGAYVKAGQESRVTFSYIPEVGGYTVFHLLRDIRRVGSFSLEITGDTLVNYDPYLINKSWLGFEDGKWFYNIELCDRPGINMPLWIPSDSICLKVRSFHEKVLVGGLMLRDEIREYLKMLPYKGGNGDYRFTYKIPIDNRGEGEYFIDSYLGDYRDGRLYDYNTLAEYLFHYDISAPVVLPGSGSLDGNLFDLQGRGADAAPVDGHLYIRGGRKWLTQRGRF